MVVIFHSLLTCKEKKKKNILFPPSSNRNLNISVEVNGSCDPACQVHWCLNAYRSLYLPQLRYQYAWKTTSWEPFSLICEVFPSVTVSITSFFLAIFSFCAISRRNGNAAIKRVIPITTATLWVLLLEWGFHYSCHDQYFVDKRKFLTTFVLFITSWLQTDVKLRRTTTLCWQQVVQPDREGGRINRETNTVYSACISRQLEVSLVTTPWIVCRAECHRVSLSTTRSRNTAVSEPSFNPLILLSGPVNNAQQTPDTLPLEKASPRVSSHACASCAPPCAWRTRAN